MKHTARTFARGIILTLLAALTVLLCSCGGGGGVDYIFDTGGGDTAPASLQIHFSDEFLELAGYTPEEWLVFLEENNPVERGWAEKDSYRGGVSLYLEEGYGQDRWIQLGRDRLEELCQEYKARYKDVNEGCIIEINLGCTEISIVTGGVERSEAEDYIHRARVWCEFVRRFEGTGTEVTVTEYNSLHGLRPESAAGISFEKIVCRYDYEYTDRDGNLVKSYYIVYPDNTCSKFPKTVLKNPHDLPEGRAEAIISIIRSTRFWTPETEPEREPAEDDDFPWFYSTVTLFDEVGNPVFSRGGGAYAPERYSKVESLIYWAARGSDDPAPYWWTEGDY